MTAVEPINFKRASRHERTFKQKESNAFACNKELIIEVQERLLRYKLNY